MRDVTSPRRFLSCHDLSGYPWSVAYARARDWVGLFCFWRRSSGESAVASITGRWGIRYGRERTTCFDTVVRFFSRLALPNLTFSNVSLCSPYPCVTRPMICALATGLGQASQKTEVYRRNREALAALPRQAAGRLDGGSSSSGGGTSDDGSGARGNIFSGFPRRDRTSGCRQHSGGCPAR